MPLVRHARLLTAVLAMAALSCAGGACAAASAGRGGTERPSGRQTATPIRHLVVIFDENVSFDHYFGTYPYAPNPPGQPAFHARPGTPTVNGLYSDITKAGLTGPLLTRNPNLSNPVRLGHDQPMTCDQDHFYTAEQNAADHGLEDLYAQNTGLHQSLKQCLTGLTYLGRPEPIPAGADKNYAVMDYYDGNTVTGLWNYAQHFAMSDDNYGTTYGTSTLGALNVTAASTYGATCGPAADTINDRACAAPPGLNTASLLDSHLTTGQHGQPAAGPGTVTDDADPTYDICSYLPSKYGGDGFSPADTVTMGGNNIGQELTTAGITWGWFEGGFDHGYVPGHGTPPTTAQICAQHHANVGGVSVTDYVPHHEPFQYYASTANPMHLPPTSVAMIGRTDRANHQYDIADFWAAAGSGRLPAVSYLKAPAYQDGHAGYSDPLDEQTWLADTVNHLEALPTWPSTAIIVTWDDSDGWYDHVLGPVQTESQTSLDSLTGPGQCGHQARQVPKTSSGKPEEGRCGLGPRLPFLVISPFAKSDYVDAAVIDQSSVLKFIEYNWRLPALGNGAADADAGSIDSMFSFRSAANAPLFIDPRTGEPVTRAVAVRRLRQS
jgi:phospholipase C